MRIDNSKLRTLHSVKTEQYSRRNTTVLVGLPVDQSETKTSQGKLIDNVVKQLSTVSKIPVKAENLSAVHRNAPLSTDGRSSRSKQPPSVTVCFYNSNLKDSVLSNYYNFDRTKKKSRDVRLYQSLTKYYSDLKSKISSVIKAKLGDKKVKWIHWRSQSMGLVVKLKDNTTFKHIFSFEDFDNQFSNYSG